MVKLMILSEIDGPKVTPRSLCRLPGSKVDWLIAGEAALLAALASGALGIGILWSLKSGLGITLSWTSSEKLWTSPIATISCEFDESWFLNNFLVFTKFWYNLLSISLIRDSLLHYITDSFVIHLPNFDTLLIHSRFITASSVMIRHQKSVMQILI